MDKEKERIAKVFKAFADPNRLVVLELLQSGEKCACVLQENLEIGQSTLSHHMKILSDAGVVESRKEGKWTHYSIAGDGAKNAIKLLEKITAVTVVTVEEKCSVCGYHE